MTGLAGLIFGKVEGIENLDLIWVMLAVTALSMPAGEIKAEVNVVYECRTFVLPKDRDIVVGNFKHRHATDLGYCMGKADVLRLHTRLYLKYRPPCASQSQVSPAAAHLVTPHTR